MPGLPYRTLSAYLRERFGKRVQKISLDAGLSCPHRDSNRQGGCIYCNAEGSGTGAQARRMGLTEQIESQMQVMARRYGAQAFIAYFQSFSNTYAPLQVLKPLYDTILPFPGIVGLAIGTRPDCIDASKLDLVASYAPGRDVWIEYGLQSASDKTLTLINRGHDVKAFVDAVTLTSRYPLRQCAHVILGLPGEGMEHYLETARLVSSLPITDIKIHLLYVIRGTPLEDLHSRGGYSPLTLDGYARAAAAFIAHLREDIVIQRITGDPHPDELVAPLWALEKARVREAIHQALAKDNLSQGCRVR
ncbi:MAG: TIGR01212 family radical SAM protein [Syntrophaceae bacterium]